MRRGPLGAFSVALALSVVSGTVLSQSVSVQGIAAYKDKDAKGKWTGRWTGAPKREVGLYGLPRKAGPRIAVDVTSEEGLFRLFANYQMSDEIAYVVDEQAAALPLPVKIPSTSTSMRQAEKVRLELLPCDPTSDFVPDEYIKTCLRVAGQTHRAKLRAGAESPSQADEAFRHRAHTLLMNVPAWEETDIRDVLAELELPLADGSTPRLRSVTKGDILQDARKVLAGRIGQCFEDVKAAAGEGGYVALGDRCEGDTEVLTSGIPKLVSLTEGAPRLDTKEGAVTLAWDPLDVAVCLTVQPQSVDRSVTKLPRWRMTRRAPAGEDRFSWSIGRARTTGVISSPLGFLAEPCSQDLHHGPMYIPVRVAGPAEAEQAPFFLVIRTTAAAHKVDVTIVETYVDGTVDKTTPKIGSFSPRDPHPLIWFEIPRSSKGPATARVLVTLRGSGTFGDQQVGPFFFKHD